MKLSYAFGSGCLFSLLVLKGTYHYWRQSSFYRGLKQMEGSCGGVARSSRTMGARLLRAFRIFGLGPRQIDS